MTDRQIKVLIGLVVVIWAMTLLIQGHPVPIDYLKAFSYSVTGVSFALFFWERWLWSWRLFRPWLTSRPDLRGTWKGEVVSNWVDPETGKGRGQIETYLVIRQTYSKLDARLLTHESSSETLSASVLSDGEGIHTVAVVYRNTPRALLRERSPIGHGGMLLHVRGTPVHQLDGEYWTDRQTKGEIRMAMRSAELCEHFSEAQSQKYDGELSN
jgi:predicted pore-forming effector associated with SMODS systems